MIHFEDLKFAPCPDSKDGNHKATVTISKQQFDIIKKFKTRTYKLKAFDVIHNKKWYRCEVFPEYCPDFPEFAGRDALMVFLNEIDQLESLVPRDIEEDIIEENEL